MTPTQRTDKFLRERAMLVAKTETCPAWGKGKVKQDLFGFADTLALNPTTFNDALLIQSTSNVNHMTRVNKIMDNEHLPIILRHFRIEVWSWGTKGGRGKQYVDTPRRSGFKLHADYCTVSTFDCHDSLY